MGFSIKRINIIGEKKYPPTPQSVDGSYMETNEEANITQQTLLWKGIFHLYRGEEQQ